MRTLYIQPAAGDSGGALGAALYVYHVLLGQPRAFVRSTPTGARRMARSEMLAAIEASGFPYERIDDDERSSSRAVDDILARQGGRLVPGAL